MIDRQEVADRIEQMLQGRCTAEDLGWWAFDLLLDEPEFEPGFEKLLRDVLQALHYFHDDDPMARQFCPEPEEILYYLRCLKGKEVYRPSAVMHWRV